jgi:hypothetical protein
MFSAEKRGLWLLKSLGSVERSFVQCPLMRPRLRTPYAVMPTPSSRHVGRIVLSMPREMSEYSICKSLIGCAACAPEGCGSGFRQANVSDITGLDHFCHCADRVLDGHGGIDSSKTIDVDPIGSKPAQGVSGKGLDGGRAAVHAQPVSLRIAQRTALHADNDLLSVPSSQRVAEQQLVVPHAVVVACVEQCDAGVQRMLMQDKNSLEVADWLESWIDKNIRNR